MKKKTAYIGTLFAPTGSQIIGSVDLVPGLAGFDWVTRTAEGIHEPDWSGETELDWNGQRTIEREGERLLEDETGVQWKESECIFVRKGSGARTPRRKFNPKARPAPAERVQVMITPQERATILAALRYYQEYGQAEPALRSDAIHDIATDCGRVISLHAEAIDALCERINK